MVATPRNAEDPQGFDRKLARMSLREAFSRANGGITVAGVTLTKTFQTVRKLGESLRPAAQKETYRKIFDSGRSQGSKKRTKEDRVKTRRRVHTVCFVFERGPLDLRTSVHDDRRGTIPNQFKPTSGKFSKTLSAKL